MGLAWSCRSCSRIRSHLWYCEKRCEKPWHGLQPTRPSTTGVSGTCLGIILTTLAHIVALFCGNRCLEDGRHSCRNANDGYVPSPRYACRDNAAVLVAYDLGSAISSHSLGTSTVQHRDAGT